MRGAREHFMRRYGASPLHLLAAVTSFAVVGAAVAGWLEEPAASLKYILIWFVGAIIAHDLLLLPFYTSLDRLAAGTAGRRSPQAGIGPPAQMPGRVYVRVPALLSGLLLLVFFPEILREGDATFQVASGQSQNVYLSRYLIIVAILFALSAAAYLISRARARGGAQLPAGSSDESAG